MKEMESLNNGEWLQQLSCLDCAMGDHLNNALSGITNCRYLGDVSALEVTRIEKEEIGSVAGALSSEEQVSQNEESTSR